MGTSSEKILEMRAITKDFPGVRALDDVTFSVAEGEIHAVCGENGAGKSTLIKILSGVHTSGSYDGEILIRGEKFSFRGTSDAEKQGVVCIHQELELVPELSVGENVFLGNYPTRFGIIQWNRVYYETRKLLSRVGLDREADFEGNRISPDEKIINLGIGQRQLVEIAKALARDARILILDEPTAALTTQEVETLLGILKGLRDKGITCIYISHRLDEVIQIADTVTILRDGKTIETASIQDITKADIIRMMVGRELTSLFPREEHSRRELVLEVEHLSVQDPDVPDREMIRDVSFYAYRGEILGVAGLMGAGRTELFSSIFGTFPGARNGSIRLNGRDIRIDNSYDAMKHGIFLVTEDRKRFGLVLGMDIKENTTLASLREVSHLGLIDSGSEIHETEALVQRLRTKTPSVEVQAKTLSGGNQQKVVLQKALMTRPTVLILDEPTRGIDVGAKFEIYKIMNQLVQDGVVIIMISSEMEEILGMSDRIIVISDGTLTAEFSIQEATQEKIMNASIGGRV
jgi:D-xylose transport system ATP-binding protein